MQRENIDEGRRVWMRRAAFAAGGGAAAALLGGCAGVMPIRTLSLSQQHLTEVIARRFPFQQRYLQSLDVEVGVPRLRLLPQSNRIATEMQVTAGERLLKRAWHGVLGLSHGLRYEPSDGTLRVTELRVDRLDVSGAPSLMESQLARIAVPLAEQLLHDFPVHRFKPEDLRGLQGLRYVPAGIRVTDSGVSITLEPHRVR